VPAVLVGKDKATTGVDKLTLLNIGTRSVFPSVCVFCPMV